MEEFNVEELFQGLFFTYYKLYPDMQKIKINTIISDCLSKSYFEIRPDLKTEHSEEQIKNTDDLNGMMVLPYKVGETINILLNRSKMDKYTSDRSMTWLGTFAHELTHAIDFYQMAVKENLDYYTPLLDTSKYYMFQLWSEYHARKLGYAFLRNILNADFDKTSIIEYIRNEEWPTHLNRYFKEYHQNNNGYNQLNLTMQLLGRYSVWCDLYPEVFNESVFEESFTNTPWMHNLFVFLRQHSSLDLIYSDFEDMRLILSENWKV